MPCPTPDAALAPQDHGGNLREAQAALGLGLGEMIDFSASINPLGQPEGLREAIAAAWHEVSRYPDRDCRALRDCLSRHLRVPATCLVIGNGSAELIDLLLRAPAPQRLLLSPPDFGLYQELLPRGLPMVRVPRRETRDFLPDIEGLRRTVRAGDLVLLSNPCNPSGRYAPVADLAPLLERCNQVGAQLAIDEAFADFQPRATWLERAPHEPHLLVLRSLTKFYAIAGLRLGFAVCPPERAAQLHSSQVPWSVNALAQEAGRHCVQCADWSQRTLTAVHELRTRLSHALAALPGVTPLRSDVNYLLLHLSPPAPPAHTLYEALARRGLLTRHCGSFGLGERYLRVAVRTGEENAKLLRAMTELLPAPASEVATP